MPSAARTDSEQRQQPRTPLPDRLKPLLEECRPLYALLRRHALRPLSTAVPRLLGGSRPCAAQGQQEASGRSGGGDGGSSGERGQGAGETAADGGRQQQQKGGTHVYKEDSRNADILIGIRDGVTGGLAGADPLSFACCARCRLTAWSQQASRGSGKQNFLFALPPTTCLSNHPSASPIPLPPVAGQLDLVWRPEAKVSVLDSGFLLGDGVWEGIRLHRGTLLFAQVGWCRVAGSSTSKFGCAVLPPM